ncbi:MAG: hypothetical protein HYV40_05035 [Candidatus Levybacteria bacterium]|nr:hypothetical protein [Candidatus Levybacteria bacterium]
MPEKTSSTSRLNNGGKNHLVQQIGSFIDLLQDYNKNRLMPRAEEDYTFLRDFFPRFIEDQNTRAKEVSSEKYQKILETAKKQFPHKPHWVLCVDGRVLVVLAYGATADLDDSVRVAGGMLREFVRGTDGKLFLRENSNFARLLIRALETSETNAVVEIFDSHMGCAARKVEEESKGKYPEDAGLLADVHHKKQMATATHVFVKKHFGEKKYAICIQTSFDPHTGFIYMGFETPLSLQYANRKGRVYTKEVIGQLVHDGLVISTEQLVDDPKIQKILKKYDFLLAWKQRYVESAVTYWKNLASMKEELLPILKKKLLGVYPELKLRQGKRSQEELEARAMLLLLNIYSGYLENLHPEDGEGARKMVVTDAHHPHAYAYSTHEEEAVRVSEGAFPPYQISAFTVFSLDEVNLPSNIELACTLVRSNQKDARIHDRSKTFIDPLTFAHAPVPVFMQEIVRDHRLTREDWEKLSKIDWADLSHLQWDSMTREEFDEYLLTKAKLPQSLVVSLQRLRHKMQIVWNPDQAISHHLINQDEVILPVLADRSRYIHTVIPFVKLGYQQG